MTRFKMECWADERGRHDEEDISAIASTDGKWVEYAAVAELREALITLLDGLVRRGGIKSVTEHEHERARRALGWSAKPEES